MAKKPDEKGRLMAEGYKAMAKENIQLAEQFFEMLSHITLKLPKPTDKQIDLASIKAYSRATPTTTMKEVRLAIAEAIIQAQIDLIKEANKNIKWEEG